jgi:hypothetical protein
VSYGNWSQPGSPHVGDQLELLAKQQLKPVWLTRADIESNLERRETRAPVVACPRPQASTLRSRDCFGLWLLAIAAAAAVGTHGIVYWDAGDYVRLALDGGTSGLALGRPLFLFVSRLVLATGVDPLNAEFVLRWFWTAVGATAAPALAVLASRLDLNRSAAIAAGLALALSPSFAHTNHQVLTDTPALALSIAALIAATYSQAIAAGLLLAAAIATRETVRRAHRRHRDPSRPEGGLAMLVVAVALAAILLVFPPPGLASWWQLMSQSTVARAATPSGVFKSVLWVLAAGPVPVVVGIFVLARRPAGRWLVVSVPALIATGRAALLSRRIVQPALRARDRAARVLFRRRHLVVAAPAPVHGRAHRAARGGAVHHGPVAGDRGVWRDGRATHSESAGRRDCRAWSLLSAGPAGRQHLSARRSQHGLSGMGMAGRSVCRSRCRSRRRTPGGRGYFGKCLA